WEKAAPMAAERSLQPGPGGWRWYLEADAGGGERRGEARWAEPVEHRDGGHVQRILQGLARADLAEKAAVEIARRVVTKMARPVVEDRRRMDDQPVEGHRVDKRL